MVTDMNKYFLIKHGTYYRPNCRGYTENISRAGIYSEEFALDYAQKSMSHDSKVYAEKISDTTWSVEELEDQVRTLTEIINAKKEKDSNP